jgi:hypothetical protein
MPNISMDVNIISKGPFEQIQLNFEFPTCGCPIVVFSDNYDVEDIRSWVNKFIGQVRDHMMLDPVCPICCSHYRFPILEGVSRWPVL